eukprot:scaffold4734_cov123-Skeletonema_dohrnii-CCMP3373.AAC.2
MKPTKRHDYQVEPSIETAAFVLVKYIISNTDNRIISCKDNENNEWQNVLRTLSCLSKDFHSLISNFERILAIDFSPLRLPRLNYEDQTKIDPHHVDMATSLMIAADLNPGIAVRYISGEYTGQNRDPGRLRDYVHGHVDAINEEDAIRLLTEGAPYKFVWEESRKNKLTQMEIGNQSSVDANKEAVKKTINKEHRYSHLLTVHNWVLRFSPYCRHNMQGMNMKKGKARLVWDATTIPPGAPWLTVINRIAPREHIREVTYGKIPIQFMEDILNLRASYPNEEIYTLGPDIKACFRFLRVHPDLVGALGFSIQGLYHLATAMVFGHLESASSWEPFRRIIERMALVEFNGNQDLESKHKYYLDMLNWDEFNTDTPTGLLQRSAMCSQIRGVLDEQGRFIQRMPRIFVDDALVASLCRHMKRLLASLIEAIFNVMGKPDTRVRQNHLAMDKWIGQLVSWRNIFLGLTWDTRALTVGIPREYIDEVSTLIKKSGLLHRKTFTVPEVSRIIGKIGHIGQAVKWIYHLISHLYASVSYALTKNRKLLASNSREFNDLLQVVQGKKSYEVLGVDKDEVELNVVSYARSRVARMPHHSKNEFPIVKTMKREMNILAELLQDNSINWCSPMAHIVERDPIANSFGDACLDQMGGFSVKLRFIWDVVFPNEIVQRTVRYVKSDPDQIGINVLEFIAIIINYAAALTAITEEFPEEDPFPILLNWADNKSAVKWIRICIESIAGRRLAVIFCFLIMDSPLGINAKWIAGDENEIADAISRLKSQAGTHNFSFDYSFLKQKYPILRNCRRFQPSPELLSMLWTTTLTESIPTLDKVRQLKQRGLGKLVM